MTRSFSAGTIASGLMALALMGCAPQQTGTLLSGGQAQTASTVQFGTITGSRAVTLSGEGSTGVVVGTLAGGLLGGLAGDQVGGGRGRVIATGVGATAGAAAGNRLANQASQRQSIEWFVQLESGRTISVIQADPVFANGQRVQVVQNGSSTRIVPA